MSEFDPFNEEPEAAEQLWFGELLVTRPPKPLLFKVLDKEDGSLVGYAPIAHITGINEHDDGTVSFVFGPRERLVILDNKDEIERFWDLWEVV
jgi:hypothetical protein